MYKSPVDGDEKNKDSTLIKQYLDCIWRDIEVVITRRS